MDVSRLVISGPQTTGALAVNHRDVLQEIYSSSSKPGIDIRLSRILDNSYHVGDLIIALCPLAYFVVVMSSTSCLHDLTVLCLRASAYSWIQ